MGEARIVAAARTPIGTAFRGTLKDVGAYDLAIHAITNAVDRAGLDPAIYDDVIMGESRYGGGDMARYAATESGLEHVAGLAHNRHCASGLAAITTAAGSIRAGMDKAVIAGGAESASTAPRFTRRVPGTDEWDTWAPPSHVETPDAPIEDMSITVGWNAAVEAKVSREEMDAWAFRSHQRAIAAIDEGRFVDEIAPFEVDGTVFAVDEHPRRNSSLEKLASLKPIHPEIEGFSITAGNSSGVNDGGAALVIVDDSIAAESLATVKAWASVGVAPARTGLAPTLAIPKALDRAGLDIADVALWEINEAFASMCVGTTKLLGIDEEIVNVEGSGCSLGHPVAMTGARMVISLVHELRRRDGGIGVAAMCAGGGMATAVVVEVLMTQFDHLAPEMGDLDVFHAALDAVRAEGIIHSDNYEGFWLMSRYEDVLAVAQDWQNFSSAHGITVPPRSTPLPAIPEQVDPPIQREFKRLINRYFTPAQVLPHEDATRAIVNRLIDEFIESGECEFMSAFADQLPGLIFFEEFLHASGDEVDHVNDMAAQASRPNSEAAIGARKEMIRWIFEFADRRRASEPRGDVIDAILEAEIEGRPITDNEVVGVIQILLFGGLDTTAGALGTTMMRFCEDPSLPERLREDPSRIPDAIEELMRLDGPFAFIGRRALADVTIGGAAIKKDDMVIISWAAANRDESEFECPAHFDLDRDGNRHIAFGAGPHRCAGSNLARMNLRIAIEELITRLNDIRLTADAVRFHPGYSRAPLAVPIAFTPGPRLKGASS